MLVLTRCPVCRARFGGDEAPDDPCHRCGSDLRHVRSAFVHAARYRREAERALAAGDAVAALAAARRAVALVDESETRATLCAALAAGGDTAPS